MSNCSPEESASVNYQFLMAGTMKRVEGDDWCEGCNNPAKQKGEMHLYTDRGATRWGWVVGCFECLNWRYFTLDGREHTKQMEWRKHDDDNVESEEEN